jgi:phosphoribosyl 1,2-cyclic phosphodiesterase
MIRACPLFSGSSGNSVYISDGRTSVLVDAGHCGRTIENALDAIDVLPASLAAILVTHEHIDHVRGIGVMMRRYHLPVYANEETWRAMRSSPALGRFDPALARILPVGEKTAIGDMCVQSVSTPHDAVNPVGYRIVYGNRNVSVFTDLGHASPALTTLLGDSDLLFFESNYDHDMLYNGPYPWHLKRRIGGGNGHLSNSDCAVALQSLLRSGVTRFVLSHLSQENNTPSLARAAAVAGLESCGAAEGNDYLLDIAPRYTPGKIWEL